jgi:hypothetical protein
MVSALMLIELRDKPRTSEAENLIKTYLEKLSAKENLSPGGQEKHPKEINNSERVCVPVAR